MPHSFELHLPSAVHEAEAGAVICKRTFRQHDKRNRSARQESAVVFIYQA